MHTEVTCPAGTVVGVTRDGARWFESVPYSRIVGAFDDPLRVEQGLLIDATRPQPGTASLSVTTPDGARPGDDLPVVVWIHGGRYEVGDHTETFMHPEAFARAGVVLVRVGYRLKFPGFLPLHTDAPGHFRGVADCAEALAWLQRNVESFGGDPTNVTVVGQSAGAGIALWLARRDHYKGEFRRALALSPAFPRRPFSARKWAARAALSTPLTRDALNALYRDNPQKMERGYQRFRTQYITDCAVGPHPFDGRELAQVDLVVTSTRDEFINHGAALDRAGLGGAFVRSAGRRMGLKKGTAGEYVAAVKAAGRPVAGQFNSDALIRRWVDEACEHAPGNVWQAEFPAGTHSSELAALFRPGTELNDWLLGFARGGEVGWEVYRRRRQAWRVGEGATHDPLGYLRGCF